MSWEDAALKAIEELSEKYPEWSVAYLALMIRAGQLTTTTERKP